LSFGLSQEWPWLLLLGIFIPFPFWFVEADYKAKQERFIGRFWAIRRFIRNGEYNVQEKLSVKLADCFAHETFGTFPVPDYSGSATLSEAQLKKYGSTLRNFCKPKMVIFYLPPILGAALAMWLARIV